MGINTIFNKDSKDIQEIHPKTIDLIITSPPYYNIVDYKSKKQIGCGNSYTKYLEDLSKVWKHCIRILKDSGTICINVCSSIELSRNNQNRYLNIKYEIENYFCENNFYVDGSIILDLYNNQYEETEIKKYIHIYPQEKYVFLHNYEHMVIFRKMDNIEHDFDKRLRGKPNYINAIWKIPWNYNQHPPNFSPELVRRLIVMFSKPDDIVFDPFIGTGTVAIEAYLNNRKFSGYELDPKTYEVCMNNVNNAINNYNALKLK